MQLVEQTLSTTTQELTRLQQWCILNDIKGDVNLTFKADGNVEVWQPDKMPVAESVGPIPTPRVISLDRNNFVDTKGTEPCL